MPEEFSRTTKRKRIRLPSGDIVEIPVITKISFIDPHDRYQEWEYSINNGLKAARVVRVDDVPANGGDETLPVERIKKWSHIDPHDRYQETVVELDNETGKDEIPPHFSTHRKTHTVKYKKRNEDDTFSEDIWVKSELIDSFSVVDPHDRYQEKIFTLNNPETDDEAQSDPEDPDITNIPEGQEDSEDYGEGADDNPVRTDPFQNIVSFSGGELFVVIGGTGFDCRIEVFNGSGDVSWTADIVAPIGPGPTITCAVDSAGDVIVAFAHDVFGETNGLQVVKYHYVGTDNVEVAWTWNATSLGFTGDVTDVISNCSIDANDYFTVAFTADSGDTSVGEVVTINGDDGTLINHFHNLPTGEAEFEDENGELHFMRWISGHTVNPDGQVLVATTSTGMLPGYTNLSGNLVWDGGFGFFYDDAWVVPTSATIPATVRSDYSVIADAFWQEHVESQTVCTDGLGNFYGSVFHNGNTEDAVYGTTKLYKWSPTGSLLWQKYLSAEPSAGVNSLGGINCNDGDINGNLYYSYNEYLAELPNTVIKNELVKLDAAGNTVWTQSPPDFTDFVAASDGLICSTTADTYEKRNGETPATMEWRNTLGVAVLAFGRQNKRG